MYGLVFDRCIEWIVAFFLFYFFFNGTLACTLTSEKSRVFISITNDCAMLQLLVNYISNSNVERQRDSSVIDALGDLYEPLLFKGKDNARGLLTIISMRN